MSTVCSRGMLAVSLAAAAIGCERAAGPDTPVLATVNGTPITEADLRLKLESDTHRRQKKRELTPEVRENLLQGIVREELAAQAAVELGLDGDPAYREKMRELQAGLDAFRRKTLSELYDRREVVEKAQIGEAEARRYFEQNVARIKTELHVYQILRRSKAEIDQIQAALERGESFEDVAQSLFPGMTEAKPWDLGYLSWKQIPESWTPVVESLREGEVSGVISGPSERYWIVKLIARRERQDATFEAVRPMIVEVLKVRRTAELRQEAERRLTAEATIVR